jgi:hypothetical protein
MSSEIIYKPYLTLNQFLPESYSVLSEYICPLCKGILCDPVLEQCGTSIYCRTCLERYLEREGRCPGGRKCSSSSIISMDFVARLINKQECLCRNKDFGCDWKGRLCELQEHLNTDCKTKPVKCTFEGCDVEMIESALLLHSALCLFRCESCKDCNSEVKVKDIEKHIDQCPKRKIPCVNDCGEEITRESQEEHKKFCFNSSAECQYKIIGCKFASTRRNLNDHIIKESEKHDQLILNEIIGIKTVLSRLKDRVEDIEITTDENTDRVQKILETFHKNTLSEFSKGSNFHSTNKSEKSALDKASLDPPVNFIRKKRARDEEHVEMISLDESVIASECEEEVVGEISPFEAHTPEKENVVFKSADKKKFIEEEVTFDLLDISKGISIKLSTASCNSSLPKLEHRFAMTNNILNGSNCEWKVKISSLNGKWLGLGLCLKQLVISNKFKFVANKQTFVHGTFLISTNGYSWNTNYDQQNNKFIANFPQIKSGDELAFTFYDREEKLEIAIGNFKVTLNEIIYPKGSYLVPCVVFLNPGDEVTFSNMIKF